MELNESTKFPCHQRFSIASYAGMAILIEFTAKVVKLKLHPFI